MSIPEDAWEKNWAEAMALEVDKATSSIKKLLREIFSLDQGIDEIEWSFYGSGDSGEISLESSLSDEADKLAEEVIDHLYSLLPGGWEINEGSSGSIKAIRGQSAIFTEISWLEYSPSATTKIELV